MIEYFLKACEVCEQGALTQVMRQVAFKSGRLQAFNGIVQYQAPSGLNREEVFAVSEAKLLSALRSCSEKMTAATTKEFLMLKQHPLTVRVRKIHGEEVKSGFDIIQVTKEMGKQSAADLDMLNILKRLAPFVSDDASRPWSRSVLIKDGYFWATNNLSVVRAPVKVPKMLEGVKLPAPAVHFLCTLPSLDNYNIDENGRVVLTSKRALVRFPQSQPDWPDLSGFFKNMPDKLPEVSEELRTAAERVKKFADRFVSLNKDRVESKQDSLESEYEVDITKGKGTYNSALLTLILSAASHIDFSFFPEPIFFRGEGLEGTAVGMKQ